MSVIQQRFTNLRDKLSNEYIIDRSELHVPTITCVKNRRKPLNRSGGGVLRAWNLTMLMLGYEFNDNMLIVGEPGSGKTTTAKVISAVRSGIPLDMYAASQLQGFPEQTKEELIARLDYGRLETGREKVIWQMGVGLWAVILDEFNRLPEGKQAVLLNWMQTGRVSYLNASYSGGKVPFYATTNHPDGANNIIIPAMCDRFAFSVEQGYQGIASDEIREAESRIRNNLVDPATTSKIIHAVNQSDFRIEELKSVATANSKEYKSRLDSLELNADLSGLVDEILGVRFSVEARVFLDCMEAEGNYNGWKGFKRSNEALVVNTHTQDLAGVCFTNGISPRAIDAIRRYSQSVAYLLNEENVTISHVAAVAPYVLAHRLQWSDTFRREREADGGPGGDSARDPNTVCYNNPREDLFLATKMVEICTGNFSTQVYARCSLINAYGDPTSRALLSESQRARATKLVEKAAEIDHPFLKIFAATVKRDNDEREK